jgi:hypothetical protein
MNRHVRRGSGTDVTGSGRAASTWHSVKPTGGVVRLVRRLRRGPVVTERREGSNQQLARNACRRRPTPERDQRRGGGGLDR